MKWLRSSGLKEQKTSCIQSHAENTGQHRSAVYRKTLGTLIQKRKWCPWYTGYRLTVLIIAHHLSYWKWIHTTLRTYGCQGWGVIWYSPKRQSTLLGHCTNPVSTHPLYKEYSIANSKTGHWKLIRCGVSFAQSIHPRWVWSATQHMNARTHTHARTHARTHTHTHTHSTMKLTTVQVLRSPILSSRPLLAQSSKNIDRPPVVSTKAYNASVTMSHWRKEEMKVRWQCGM